ncbi:hypothetical protein BU23DRAFT_568120 [Bimuria novae-zelandiae CBS 107.79]|uniref:DUF7730 domain-containing protein n=1 Tax=Bimuria novae-zelandiae CBS 107.79 TaxID=1447943 RepID=A0A6A5VFC6_9PLEO|nr:hypothetical protein BU23DRAFT_568120 [Bimuria novae-zelandiae CBS 107.79]
MATNGALYGSRCPYVPTAQFTLRVVLHSLGSDRPYYLLFQALYHFSRTSPIQIIFGNTNNFAGSQGNDRLAAKSRMLATPKATSVGDCVALLQTCRQIYTEAVGTLYSNNTFMPPTNHLRIFPPSALLEFGVEWMVALGSQLPLLRRVSSNLKAEDLFQLLPLCPSAGTPQGPNNNSLFWGRNIAH